MLRIVGLAIVLALVAAAGASACSCAGTPPGTQLRESDAAFIGTIRSVREEMSDGFARRVYTVDVDKVYKGAVGATAEVRGSTEASGSTCAIRREVGQELGGFFRGAPETWFVGSCNVASRERLEQAAAEAAAPEDPAAGAAAFIAIGASRSTPLVIVDAQARVVRRASELPGDLPIPTVSACPGGTHFIEDAADGVRVRRIGDLSVVGAIGQGRFSGTLRCIHPEGLRAVAFERSFMADKGRLALLEPGVERTIARGRFALEALGTARSALACINPGGPLIVVEHATGKRRTLRREPRNGYALALSPDERRVVEMVVRSRRRGERRPPVMVYDVLTGRRIARRELPGDTPVFLSDTRIAATGRGGRVYDTRLRPRSTAFSSTHQFAVARGTLWWLDSGRLRSLAGGSWALPLPFRVLEPIPAP